MANNKEMARTFYDEIHKKGTIGSGCEDIHLTHETWNGKVKVLRFKRSCWNEIHDCALTLDGTEELTIKAMAWVYADGFHQGDNTQPLIDNFRENLDRKSTRLNSSHVAISYAVFCLKKKK